MTRSSTFGSMEAFSCSPVPCPALAGCRVLQVSCGSRHTLAVVAGGQAYSWGWGALGQLGHGDGYNVATPRVIEALATGKDGGALGPVTWVSAGGMHSAAVVKGGCVYTWGGSTYGQLGPGPPVTAPAKQAVPDKVMLSETESPSSSPRATGTKRHSMTQEAAVKAMDSAPKTELLAKTVICGGMHTAALTEEGVVYCWGRADSGQLGIGTEWVHETSCGVMGVEWPRRVRGNLEGRRTASIACGGFHTAAVTTEGECYTWGKEDHGMLGCSNEALLTGGLFIPHLVSLRHRRDANSAERPDGSEKAIAVACGGWHTAVIGEKGGVWTCGRGEYGRLGLGDEKSHWLPAPVSLGGGRTAFDKTSLSTVSARSLVIEEGVFPLDSGGGVSLPEMEVELGDTPLPPRAPVTAAAARTEDPAAMVALGGTHSLVLTSSGKVFGFGRLEDDRLGVEMGPESAQISTTLPLEVTSLQLDGWKVQSISAGGVHSAAILTRLPE
ncbi:unnamed protein product [Laminaria digitata]